MPKKSDTTIDELIKTLSKIQIELEETKIELRRLKEEKITSTETKVKKVVGPTDRFGTPLEKGSRVKF